MRLKNGLTLPRGTKIPSHIAIIPDGNRRWARARGFHTLQGHKRGFERAVELGRQAREWGIHTVTLWGFSTENWDRTKKEIDYLMKLYEKLVDDYLKEAMENKVRIIHLGRKDRLPGRLLKKIAQAEEKTKGHRKYIMNIALDYGGHDEIIRAVKRMMEDGVAADKIDKELFESYLDTHDQPYPYVDLLIRTSAEQRTSGLLLWQMEYAEMYWEDGHFPDFSPEKLKKAILDYSRRRRRFGGNDAVEHLSFKPEVAARLELAWWRLGNIPEGERFRNYAVRHLKEQFGMSTHLAKEAAGYMVQAFLEGKQSKWRKAAVSLKKFYKLVKDELKLAFEPSLAASLEVRLWQGLDEKETAKESVEVESTARELYAEVYRISLLQAAKLAHLRVLASVERNLAQRGFGEHHWDAAEDYLEKFYKELKDRVA